jgi:hypothetical protein
MIKQQATAGMAIRYCDIIITAATTEDKGVVDADENVIWQWLKINTVPLVQYMGNGTEDQMKIP